MYQLFYVSNATDALGGEAGIQSILEAARRFNEPEGITGMLLYRGGIFLQLLEGDRKKVEELFERIERDPRHNNVIRLFGVERNERLFGDWSMAYREVSEIDLKLINEMLSWNDLISGADSIDDELILRMLGRFKYGPA